VGDTIDPVYAEHLLMEPVIHEAIQAYNSQQYKEALDLYQSALRTPAGAQVRVYNGLYLTHWKLGALTTPRPRPSAQWSTMGSRRSISPSPFWVVFQTWIYIEIKPCRSSA
jgi:hypothetical protein